MGAHRVAKALEPDRWFIVFHRRGLAWLERIPFFGRYRHVAAYGYVAAHDLWVFVDPTVEGLSIKAGSDGRASTDHLLVHYGAAGDILVVDPEKMPGRRWPVVGATCVPIIAWMTGVPSCALRPDAFWKDCIRAGARPLTRVGHGEPDEAAPDGDVEGGADGAPRPLPRRDGGAG